MFGSTIHLAGLSSLVLPVAERLAAGGYDARCYTSAAALAAETVDTPPRVLLVGPMLEAGELVDAVTVARDAGGLCFGLVESGVVDHRLTLLEAGCTDVVSAAIDAPALRRLLDDYLLRSQAPDPLEPIALPIYVTSAEAALPGNSRAMGRHTLTAELPFALAEDGAVLVTLEPPGGEPFMVHARVAAVIPAGVFCLHRFDLLALSAQEQQQLQVAILSAQLAASGGGARERAPDFQREPPLPELAGPLLVDSTPQLARRTGHWVALALLLLALLSGGLWLWMWLR